MRAGQEAGNDIAEHNGLFQHLEDDSRYCAQHENQRQVANQTIDIE